MSILQIRRLVRCLWKARSGGLAHGTLVVLAWNIARILCQLLWVVIAARLLGVEGYGAFSGIAGLALAVSGFVGVGMSLRLYQDVARDPGLFDTRWAQSVRALAISGVFLWLGFVAGSALLFPTVSVGVLACIGLAELVAGPMVVHVAFVYGSHGLVARAAAAPVFLSMSRVFAVAAMAFAGGGEDLEAYAVLHASTTIVASSLIWMVCRRQLTPGRGRAALSGEDLRSGMELSAIWASGLALSSLDKAIALRLGGEDVAGHYVGASRFASLFALPIDSLVMAVMPRLFRAGGGLSPEFRLIRVLLAATLIYGILAGWVLWSLVGLLPYMLGNDFEDAVPALEILALYIPVYCVRVLGGNILLGYGSTRWRFACELIALSTLLVLMTTLIPGSGALGAAWAAVATETVLALLLWIKVGDRLEWFRSAQYSVR